MGEPEEEWATIWCWVYTLDATVAEHLAREGALETGWTPQEIEAIRSVTREEYLDTAYLGYYDGAVTFECCVVIHSGLPED